jgi:hypothetical protein
MEKNVDEDFEEYGHRYERENMRGKAERDEGGRDDDVIIPNN